MYYPYKNKKSNKLSELSHTINGSISLTFRLNSETKSNVMLENGTNDLLLLIDKCISNDRGAQQSLYKKYYGLLMSV